MTTKRIVWKCDEDGVKGRLRFINYGPHKNLEISIETPFNPSEPYWIPYEFEITSHWSRAHLNSNKDSMWIPENYTWIPEIFARNPFESHYEFHVNPRELYRTPNDSQTLFCREPQLIPIIIPM